ncbi:hypothetical protein [Halostagnicola sp. A-GB9-2]|uniref:DUF7511 domain-containing protein n=1 Tax=Halostagnicola sp. A-GB9-2 TaxID=3048066 RepID=UPI0024BF9739|nr:hypothetical protein [Halostagnicola sp. A-GB9-2]MDJ1433151.1 hypothetical protein [Halostagnicola sp. A-GB9-2]
MNGSSSGYGTDGVRQRLERATQYSTKSIDLDAIVVRYENQPDRCTVTPRECSESERLTTWLTADRQAFVALENMR